MERISLKLGTIRGGQDEVPTQEVPPPRAWTGLDSGEEPAAGCAVPRLESLETGDPLRFEEDRDRGRGVLPQAFVIAVARRRDLRSSTNAALFWLPRQAYWHLVVKPSEFVEALGVNKDPFAARETSTARAEGGEEGDGEGLGEGEAEGEGEGAGELDGRRQSCGRASSGSAS